MGTVLGEIANCNELGRHTRPPTHAERLISPITFSLSLRFRKTKRGVLEDSIGKKMGGQKNGVAEKWSGRKMEWQKNGVAEKWSGRKMEWQKNGVAEKWSGKLFW
ncbi:MAG: hypothetical protein ACKOOI_17000, partial [Pirellula sp.]